MMAALVGWKLPGHSWVEGAISAREAKAVGARITVAGSSRHFSIECVNRWGDDRFPWKLAEVLTVGCDGRGEWHNAIDEFPSLREAVAAAKRLAAC